MICGLTLDKSERQLALLYLATIQGIVYGTRRGTASMTTTYLVSSLAAQGKVFSPFDWPGLLLSESHYFKSDPYRESQYP
ncbi:hypothetical protein KSP40_PGU020142 [Platanthera guangdongensis]|uniref:Uncharacterized protein n=1 Tax=Platanthera guangdongensis TaxID=2320717 RepID=A0ABR2LRR4_9ASPA